LTTLSPTLNLASSTLLFVDATLVTGADVGAAVDDDDEVTVVAVIDAGAEKTPLEPESSKEMSSKLGTLTF